LPRSRDRENALWLIALYFFTGRTGVADVDVAQPLEPDYNRLGHVKQSQAIFNETD